MSDEQIIFKVGKTSITFAKRRHKGFCNGIDIEIDCNESLGEPGICEDVRLNGNQADELKKFLNDK